MTFTFTPQSEEEVLNLLAEGTYDFTVKSAEDAVSKKGNPMIKVCLIVWDKKGVEHVIYDYLLEALAYKLRHFCDAIGIMDKYNAGGFTVSDCVGKSGQVKIRVDNTDSAYPPKNTVQDYVKHTVGVTNGHVVQPVVEKFTDSDIPF